MKILITSAGSLVAQNILEVLKYRRNNLTIIGTNSIAGAALYECDKIYLCPPSALPPSAYTNLLKKIIREESPDLIIPGRDLDVVILALLKEEFQEISNNFLTGPADLARLMENKLLSHRFSQHANIPFADTILFDPVNKPDQTEQFISKYGFPLIVKPVKGFASRGVTLVLDKEQLYGLSGEHRLILQEYLGDAAKVKEFKNNIQKRGLPLFYSFEEIKYSLQLFIGRKGELKDYLVTQRKMVKGVSASVEVLKDPGFKEIVMNYYRAFRDNNWYGPLNIQMQRSKRNAEMKAYEYNGRFTGATAARYFLGYDEIGMAFEDAGYSYPEKDERYGSQKVASKQPCISVIPDKCIHMLQSNGQWERKILELNTRYERE